MRPTRQSSTINIIAPVEKQVAAESLSASVNLVVENRVNLDEINTDSVLLERTETDVAAKAPSTISVIASFLTVLRPFLKKIK